MRSPSSGRAALAILAALLLLAAAGPSSAQTASPVARDDKPAAGAN